MLVSLYFYIISFLSKNFRQTLRQKLKDQFILTVTLWSIYLLETLFSEFGRAGWTKDSNRDFYRWTLSIKDNLISSLTIYQTLTVLKGKLIKLPKEKLISCHTKPQCIWYYNFVILKNLRLCKDDQTFKCCSVPVLILLSGEVARSLSGGSAVEITQ